MKIVAVLVVLICISLNVINIYFKFKDHKKDSKKNILIHLNVLKSGCTEYKVYESIILKFRKEKQGDIFSIIRNSELSEDEKKVAFDYLCLKMKIVNRENYTEHEKKNHNETDKDIVDQLLDKWTHDLK